MKPNIKIKENLNTWLKNLNKKTIDWLLSHLLPIWILSIIVCLSVLIIDIFCIDDEYLNLILPLGAGLIFIFPLHIGMKLQDTYKREKWKNETKPILRKEEKNKIKNEMENEKKQINKEKEDIKKKEEELSKKIALDDTERNLIKKITEDGKYTVFQAENIMKDKEDIMNVFFYNRYKFCGNMTDNAKNIIKIALIYKCSDLFYPDLYRFDNRYKTALDKVGEEQQCEIIRYFDRGQKDKAIEKIDKLTGIDKIKKNGGSGGGSGAASSEADSMFLELDHDLEYMEKLPEPERPVHKKDDGIEIGD